MQKIPNNPKGIKCSLCGFEFSKEDAISSCKRCVYIKDCTFLRCPNCGFEMTLEPEWIERVQKNFTRIMKNLINYFKRRNRDGTDG